jgi:AraC-like DNA-binding protein
LPSLGVPIIALSASLPLFVLPKLTLKLCLSQKSDMSHCHIIHCENIVGVFPEGFKITVEMHTEYATKIMEFVSNTLCQCSSQDAIHVFTDVKENAMTIYKNLCKKFDCRLVTAESTQQDQMKIAEEWSNSSFRVLISTSIGLVGNENLNCKYIACAGYLHDNMQVIQAIGRLRPCQRTSYGKIFFCVPFGLPKFRIEEDENHLTSLKNENLLSSENNLDFCWTMSSRGVKLWCMAAIRGDRGCSMKLLSKVFGRDTEDCGACQACCLCP